MKNDKERKAFVENPENWRLLIELRHRFPILRVLKLTYHDKSWYRIQIMKEQNYYDHSAGDFKKRIEWVTLETCLFDPERGVFGEHWSATNIVDSIKTIDRESKS